MPNPFSRFFNSGISIPTKDIVAARALYLSEDIQRIELTITTEAGDKLILEMTPRIARQCITQMSAAYTAINPPLKGGNSIPYEG